MWRKARGAAYCPLPVSQSKQVYGRSTLQWIKVCCSLHTTAERSMAYMRTATRHKDDLLVASERRVCKLETCSRRGSSSLAAQRLGHVELIGKLLGRV